MAGKKKTKGAAVAAGKVSVAEWLAANKGKAMTLADGYSEEVAVIPTGNFLVDNYILGIGGFPRGRIVELYGGFSSGKTTIAIHTIVAAQKAGGVAFFIDAEHAFDPGYFVALGGDKDKLVLSQPSSGEEAFDLAIDACNAGWASVIVFDSIAAMTPMRELADDMEQQSMGMHARMMAKGLRKLTAAAGAASVLLVFLNQVREKIGIVFGSNTTTPGGRAMGFYASVRIELQPVGKILEGGVAVGNKTRIRCVKNKVATPFKEAVVDLVWGKGFVNDNTLFEVAHLNNLGVEKNKNTWTVGTESFNGRAKALKAFMADDFLQLEVAEKAKALIKKGKLEIPVVERGEK